MADKVEINSFDNNALWKLARTVRRLQAQVNNLKQRRPSIGRGEIGYTIRTGITTTNENKPVYPTEGCKFVVQFEDWAFNETVGECETLTTKEWTKKFVIARAYDGKYIDENTRVIIVKIPGGKGRRWWIIPLPKPFLAEAILVDDMCATDAGGSGSGAEQVVEVTDAVYLPDCLAFTPNKVVNPRNHRGPAGSKVLMVRKRCGTEEEWQIVDVELKKVCVNVGIQDRESCLVMAGLQTGLEWCPIDEPTSACRVVDYDECGTGSGACDTDWNFGPLFACCGQGSGSG